MKQNTRYEVLKLEIGKLELSPRDILAIRVPNMPQDTIAEKINELQGMLAEILPEGINTIILVDDIRIDVIKEKP